MTLQDKYKLAQELAEVRADNYGEGTQEFNDKMNELENNEQDFNQVITMANNLQ